MPAKPPVTIEDIARAAGVSVSTVSRILNNKPDVAAATRQRVLQIIDQTGYQPQTEARRLRTGADQTRTIILHYPIEGSAFDPVENALVMLDFITGASRAVDDADCHLHLMTRPLDDDYLLDMFRSSQIDGAILMQVDVDDGRVDALRNTAYPFTMVGRCTDNS
ncbi:MAG: LacI family transcriptional regulator, partial [Anaerolineae bacterium]|nr:LacI family transcriptional regulator [Anaerolineae bacterium]